jgi:AcrR family transcriptional regulator
MSAANGKNAASSRRREEILAVAAKVFATKGIAGATVRDIADEAGILSGSLYHHFESKDQMVVEVLVPIIEAQDRLYREIADTYTDKIEVMRRFITVGLQGVADSPHTARILHNESMYFQANLALNVVHEKRQRIRRLWVSIVRDGQREGVFRNDLDPDVVVRAIFDTVYSSTRWLPPRGKSTPQRIAKQLSHLFLDGLRQE